MSDLDKILTKVAFRIIRSILNTPEKELPISKIIKNSRINHGTGSKYLKTLTKAGVLQEKIYGRIKIYRLRLEDPKVKAIVNLIDIWEKYI